MVPWGHDTVKIKCPRHSTVHEETMAVDSDNSAKCDLPHCSGTILACHPMYATGSDHVIEKRSVVGSRMEQG